MAQVQSFQAEIQPAGGGAFVVVPFDVEEVFGKKRVKVKATFDGEPYRGSVMRMGGPDYLLIIRKDIRETIGKDVGDRVLVTIEEDTEPRTVEVPQDVQAALADEPAARDFFDGLAFSHQREYITWIEDAKREATRERRITKMMDLLREGKKTR